MNMNKNKEGCRSWERTKSKLLLKKKIKKKKRRGYGGLKMINKSVAKFLSG